MPESISDKTVFSLLEVSLSIKRTISERYKSTFWVKAEMNKLNFYSHSGHCYPELVEKKDGKVLAQVRANLWKEDYFRINQQFQKILKEPLRDGINILFCARITYEPAFGLSLHILDIDPVYSLGELEKEKLETIERLKKERVYNLNKKLQFPLLPQRIAIISVETSKGYADFKNTLEENQWGYHFFHLLFPALLQGDKAIPAIRAQLERIKKVIHHFDVVAIIRGGGGDVGLSCYNNYFLSKDIAQFPLPVITGIGHATNETVSEMISYKNAITPTALASFLIQSFHDFDVPVQQAKEFLVMKSKNILNDEDIRFNAVIKDVQTITRQTITKSRFDLQNMFTSLHRHTKFIFGLEKERCIPFTFNLKKGVVHLHHKQLEFLNQFAYDIKKNTDHQVNNSFKELTSIQRIVINLSPEHVMKRGYSVTRLNGKIIRDTNEVKIGDALETILTDGVILSVVEKKQETKTINEQ